MPRSSKHVNGLKAAGTARAPGRPWNPSALNRALGLVFSATIVLGLAGGGQGPESRAEPVPLQEPANGAPLPDKAPGAAAVGPETAALRAEALERLKVFEASAAPDAATSTGTARPSPASGLAAGSVPARPGRPVGSSSLATAADPTVKKSIPELLHDRLGWLDEHERLSLALQQATQPERSPERQASEAKAELERLQRILTQAAKAPETLLPPSVRGSSGQVSTMLSSEMKAALEAALEATTNELKEWKAKIQTLRSEVAKSDSLQNVRRAERDKIFQRVTTLGAKREEFEAAVTDAQAAHERRLAQERLVNFEWEARVESLRLHVIEAEIGLDVKLADVRELTLHVCHLHVQIAQRTLEQMRVRYGVAAEDHDRDLKRAAADEESKARRSDDPLERFRARHTAELLVLEALVLKSEQAVATSPSPSLDEQRNLADHALRDSEQIKGLLDDGRVSRLDAIRLNNDFRRIGPERDRLLRNEMATVEAQLQYYEDTLTDVELELIQDSLHDRYEHDLLRERVSPSRRSEAESLLSELETRHRELLKRRRVALEKLSDRASHTLQQVVRRLGILDEEYGFIRTHIFWVRDQDPIGLGSLMQGAREFNYLLNGLLRLARETVNANLWCRPSAEFLVTALAVIALPMMLVRLRQALWRLIQRDLAAPRP